MRRSGLENLVRGLRRPAAILGVVLAGSAGADAALGAAHRSAPAAVAAANRCFLTVFAPEIHYPKLLSRITFRCTARHRGVTLTVVLEVSRSGHWKYFRQAHETLNVQAGKTVTLRTDPFTCSTSPHKAQVRTFGKAVVSDVNVTIAHPSPSWTVDCI